mmetsp:Transcript_27657/g.51372  ORF Transcript_27657/g.51372 Transcript_27657/m.51372 type:complete len:239 (-) Transcript_27657:4-720(-)
MPLIHEKIRLALKDRRMSLRSAAEVCGIKYRTLHSALADERDLSFSTLERLSGGLNIDFAYFSDSAPSVTIEELRDRNKNVDASLRRVRLSFDKSFRAAAYAGRRVSLEGFLNWWVSNNGRLEGFDQLVSHVDLFDPPSQESDRIQPVQIGPKSLATLSFSSEHVDHLRQTLEGFSTACNRKLVDAHLEALNRGEPVITHPVLDETLRDGRRFSRQYRRVLAPVYAENRTLIANYSKK